MSSIRLLTISRVLALSVVLTNAACTHPLITKTSNKPSGWVLIDNFEDAEAFQRWTNIDAQNDTKPFVSDPQISDIRIESAFPNQYMLRKPAADGVVGNRKAIGFRALPMPIQVGETATLYARINVEYFPNNQSFGLSNSAALDIPDLAYDALEPMIRVTDKAESNGQQNNGTLMVSDGYKSYARISNPLTGVSAEPLVPDTWYEVWAVINNRAAEKGGQRYDLYVRGGEFKSQQRVFTNAVFRMQRSAPLMFFMAISNTGPHDAPYGNGGVRYDDLYLARGEVLSTPLR